MASIIVVSGPSEGDYYPFQQETIVVGRDAKCPIQLIDEKISRVHFEVRFDKGSGAYVAKDLESVNGVTINGNAIADEVEMANGDLIELGETKLMFFTREFRDRKSAWDYYKIAGQRERGTMIQPPDPPAKRGLFRKKS